MKKNNTKIPFFLPCINYSDIKEIKNAALSPFLTNGPKLIEFESKFKKFTNSKYAIGVSNATAALHLSLKALGIGKNDQVIIPDLTFAATASSIIQAEATPVLADIDEKTLNISVESIKKNINKKTKAIMPVHLAGLSCDMDKINDLATSHSLEIIEDCAHAIGTKFKTKHVGNFGTVGCFSFYPTKNLTTIEGGMVTTNDKNIADFIRLARNHGISKSLMDRYKSGKPWEYDIETIGYNYRLDELRSALGISQLSKLKILNRKRFNLSLYYTDKLKDFPGIVVPDKQNLKHSACHLYIIRLTKNAKLSRDNLFYFLQKHGIETSVHYKPLHEFKLIKKNAKIKNSLHVTKKISDEILSLPLYPQLTRSNQNYIINTIKNALN